MKAERNVEVAIIGAGSAGMRAYREVSKQTDSVVLIEGSDYGTTCASVGCMPSKLLIAAAEAAHLGEYSHEFGVHYGDKAIDGKAVMARVRNERDRFVGFVVDDIENWPATHKIKGYAKFISDHRLQIDDGTIVNADRIIIATGSRPNISSTFEALGDRLIVNDDVFSWQDLPKSVAVFGAGVIGLELGQALSRLGVKVTLFGRNNDVGPLTDVSVISKATEIFTKEFNFIPHADSVGFALHEDGVIIDYVVSYEKHKDTFEFVLAATGRTPNLDKLSLDNTSIDIDCHGIPEFDMHTGRVGSSHIFIAGDVNNVLPLLHEASDEGQIAGYNAAHYPQIRRFKKSTPISVVFSDPQIMMVGKSFAELQQSNVDFEAAELDWKGQGRSRVMLLNQGLLRVYGEKNTGRFLGAEMIGPRAEHLAHLLAWSVQSNLTVTEMLERPFYHPVFEEGLRTALRLLNHKLEMGELPPARCIDCGPGA